MDFYSQVAAHSMLSDMDWTNPNLQGIELGLPTAGSPEVAETKAIKWEAAEVHVLFRINERNLVVLVDEARFFVAGKTNSDLYDLPDLRSRSQISDGLPMPPASAPGPCTGEHCSFWAEVFIRSHMHADLDVQYACQSIAQGSKGVNGSENGFWYSPVFDDAIEFSMDKDYLAAKAAQESNVIMSMDHNGNNQQDELDQLARASAHLIIAIYAETGIVGEVSFPLHTIQNHQGWYDLRQVDFSFASRLRRANRRAWNRPWGRDSKSNVHADGLGGLTDSGQAQNPWRKAVSLRTLFILLIAFQLVFVITTTAIMLAVTANSEFLNSAEQVSSAVHNTIKLELRQHLVVPKSIALHTLAFMSGPSLEYSHMNAITHLLGDLFNQTRVQGLYNTSLIYIGGPGNQFYGVGTFDDADTSPNVSNYLTLFTPADNPTKELKMAYWNTDCVSANFSCELTNFSTTESLGTMDVETRPWYQAAVSTDQVVWTDIYLYLNNMLGVTVATRVPQGLNEPLAWVSALDVTLSDLNIVLENLVYFRTGYCVIFEMSTGYLIATSLDVPLTTNSSDGSSARIKVTESADPRVRGVGEELASVTCPDQPNRQYICSNSDIDIAISTMDGDLMSSSSFGMLNSSDPWVIVVVIPRADYQGSFTHMLTVALMVSFGMLAACLVVTVFLVNALTKNLIRCTRQLARFAQLDFTTKVPRSGLHSPIKEIARIYEALQSMRLSLRSFYKYVPADVVRILVASAKEAHVGGEKRVITIFFSDVVDFTRITETSKLEELIDVLGTYLSEMSTIITSTEGALDKYIGDAIMAFWNAPETVIDHPAKACEAALQCQSMLVHLRNEWSLRGLPALAARIGIDTGTAIVGNIGARHRLNYTALGMPVLFAERLEGLNKVYGTSILISNDTRKNIGDRFVCRPVDIVVVKGSVVCTVHELICMRHEASSKQVQAAAYFTDAFKDYEAGVFHRAALKLQLFLELFVPHDTPAKLLLAASRFYHKNPPGPGWNGLRPASPDQSREDL